VSKLARRTGGFDRHVLSLLFVTLVWGATFPVLKLLTATHSGVEISALRFGLAALCLFPWAWRAPRSTWRDGGLLGALVLLSYGLQAYGLQTISSNRSAFLTSLNVLMVPFLGLAFGSRLSGRVLLAALLACAGIALMSWDGGGDPLADAATVAGAAGYALYVILLSKRSTRHDALHLAATQIVWMAVLGILWMLALDPNGSRMETLFSRLSLSAWAGLAYLGVVASAGMLFLQARAQRHVAADKAALIYAMEPVFAALFGWLALAEALTLRAAAGGALVVFAVLLSELPCRPRT
jgi:drug/metabolite transporter (DMT)-like permease